MGAVLIDQHQSGLYRSKNETSLELQVLGSLLHYGRLTGIKSCRSGCNNTFLFNYRKFFRFGIGFGERLIHLTGFLKTTVQIFPVHFRTGVIATAGRGHRRFEWIEIGIEMHLRRRRRQVLFKCRDIGHVFRIEIDRRDGIELAQ